MIFLTIRKRKKILYDIFDVRKNPRKESGKERKYYMIFLI